MRYAKLGIWVLILALLLSAVDRIVGWLWSSDPDIHALAPAWIGYMAPRWLGTFVFYVGALLALQRQWRPGIWVIFLLSLPFTLTTLGGALTSLSLIWDALAGTVEQTTSRFHFTLSTVFLLETAWSQLYTISFLAVTGGTAHFLFFAKRKP